MCCGPRKPTGAVSYTHLDVYKRQPLDRQTALVECRLTREDLPNMGVNAFTVRNGELHTASSELLIPPAGQILEPAVTPGKSQYRPGEQGNVSISCV